MAEKKETKLNWTPKKPKTQRLAEKKILMDKERSEVTQKICQNTQPSSPQDSLMHERRGLPITYEYQRAKLKN